MLVSEAKVPEMLKIFHLSLSFLSFFHNVSIFSYCSAHWEILCSFLHRERCSIVLGERHSGKSHLLTLFLDLLLVNQVPGLGTGEGLKNFSNVYLARETEHIWNQIHADIVADDVSQGSCSTPQSVDALCFASFWSSIDWRSAYGCTLLEVFFRS